MASPSDRTLYKFEREIGRGSYGRVYRARRRSDGREVAVKVIPTEEEEEVAALAAQVMAEAESLRLCESEHVLRHLASHAFDGELWLVTEYCEAGSLLDVMRSRGAPLREEEVAAAAAATLHALRYLHEECRMLHRDVKAGNLLLTASGDLRLADFGAAAQLGSTPAWTAGGGVPECLL